MKTKFPLFYILEFDVSEELSNSSTARCITQDQNCLVGYMMFIPHDGYKITHYGITIKGAYYLPQYMALFKINLQNHDF